MRNASGRLEQRRRGEIAPRWKLVDEVSRDREEVREGAGVRETGLRVLRGAEIRATFAASSAVTAGAKAFRDDGRSFADILHTRPHRFDRACPFVPGDDRVGHVGRGAPALEHLDVRTADAGGTDANEHLAGTGLGPWHTSQSGSPRPLDDDGAHFVARVHHCEMTVHVGDGEPGPSNPATAGAAD